MERSIPPFFLISFFFLNAPLPLQADFQISPEVRKCYHLILNLNMHEAVPLLNTSYSRDPHNSMFLLLANYRETLDILLTEDPERYTKYKPNERIRLSRLDKEVETPWKDLAQAEIRFQWGLVKLKFKEELSAAWDLRQSYMLVEQIEEQHPEFLQHKKLLGLFRIFIGSIPENYAWLTKILSLHGNIDEGLDMLAQVQHSESLFSSEALMLSAAIKKYVINSAEPIAPELEKALTNNPKSLSLRYLTSAILLKEGYSQKALSCLSYPKEMPRVFPLYTLLTGEIYLYKGVYPKARSYFLRFLEENKGENHIKDAYYKIFLTYWLSNQDQEALSWLKKIPVSGQNFYDSDKYADHFAREPLPNKILMKARLYCDGGYPDEALKEMATFNPEKEHNDRDTQEYWYRRGRIFQLKGDHQNAIESYYRTLEISSISGFYFAPNACLQMGYIYLSLKNKQKAKVYFSKALNYQDYEYKNSIDNKAKAALEELSEQ